ncbi:PadR family transcriptional regulator [Actinomyces sp. MRS3W]|uniref:PadR family transcriptional regulator n=1 Tax=Actinomyces sp. MRS3W TaxID=2800796 RepID=UPI0028FD63BA|nr:PadR family transcriptional regulator [Actinomyces sp. MRS3W]MDU0349561.1 PadR family transcriptional regulator [Actinomyces sp. MRS3W]
MAIKHALLALLAGGPAGTYQLRKDFESSTGTAWPLNIGQVATTLARLERDGLVARLEPGALEAASHADAASTDTASGPAAEPAPSGAAANPAAAASAAKASNTTTLTTAGRDVAAWALTDAGRAELAHWWAKPVMRSAPDRDELVIKLALAATRPDVDVADLIQRQREATQTTLHEINRARRAAAEDLAATLVLDHHVFTVEAELRWLDDVEGRLARARNSSGR